MAKIKNPDPDSAGAIAAVEAEQDRETIAKLEQQRREQLTAQVHQFIGRIQASNMMSEFADVSSLIWLKQIKETKIYKEIQGFTSWESFCNYLGKSSKHVDEQLQNLKVLGAQFLLTVSSFSVGYRELRKLRYAAQDGDLIIDTEAVTIGEEKIPLTPDCSEDIEAAIQSLLEAKVKKIGDQAAIIKAKERIIKSKDELIGKQEIEIARHEKKLKEKGFAPGEEEFLKQLRTIQLEATSIFNRLEPTEINRTDATPRMIASYLELVGFLHRWSAAIHDTAVTDYGNPDIDGGWTPGATTGSTTEKASAEDGNPVCVECKANHPACNNCCNICSVPCDSKRNCRYSI